MKTDTNKSDIANKKNNRKVLVCSNYAWTVFNFRMPLIKDLAKSGFRVEVLTQLDGYEKKFIPEVDKVHSLFISRKGINVFTDLLTLFDIFRKLINIKPDILLLFTIKPVIYGSIASKFTSIHTIPMITGLGTSFLLNNWITVLVKTLYRLALKKIRIVFFQNKDDKDLFIKQNLITRESARLIPGSGIDLKKFKICGPPNNNYPVFLLISRMLWDKGIGEFVEAASILKSKYPNVKFQLLGPVGVENRSAIPIEKITEWQEKGLIEYLGETNDVASYIEKSDCIVLPSYREGISRVLLEAAAKERPIIATDVTGCREVVENNLNGYLCKEKNGLDLAHKIEKMILLKNEKRKEMGKRGRIKVEKEFDHKLVNKIYLNAIKELEV